MSETDESVTKIFTKISHHRSVSVLYLSQNLFFSGKQNRTISLNTHYMVLFRNPRDASQISVLGKQMYPNKSKILVEAFRDATSSPYGYLLMDMRPDLEDKFRLRTGIFPGILTTFTFPNKKTDNRNYRQSVEMSSRVHKHAVQLKMLRDATPKLRKQILHHCGTKIF